MIRVLAATIDRDGLEAGIHYRLRVMELGYLSSVVSQARYQQALVAEGEGALTGLAIVAPWEGLALKFGLRMCGGVAKGGTELTKSAEKGIRSLEKRISEHEKKLGDFKTNPTVRPGMEGQSESVIKAAQESRIRHLEKEIQTFKENIEKLKGGK